MLEGHHGILMWPCDSDFCKTHMIYNHPDEIRVLILPVDRHTPDGIYL